MSTITIHAEDYIAVSLREHAERLGKSVNMAAKEILSASLGLVPKPKRKVPSFMKCAGILSREAADELRAAQADFSRVDEEMWKDIPGSEGEGEADSHE